MCEAEKDIVKQINKACEKYKECKTYDLSIVLLTGTLWKIFECIMCCWTNSASNELHLLLWTWISSLPYEREVWMLSLVLLVVVLFSVVCVCVCMCVCVWCSRMRWNFPEGEEPPSDTIIKYWTTLEVSFCFRFDNIS